MPDIHRGFQDVNPATEATAFFRFLDVADSFEPVQECKRRMLELCPVHAGDHVLDVGCGVGHEVQRLAAHVGPNGRVVGIDKSAPMIAEAQRRVAGMPAPIEYYVCDAQQLDFPDHTFTLCRTERVLRYVESPQRALAEMARVVRPGGQVVAFDFDTDLTVVDAVPQGWIGRQLPRLFRHVGLVELAVVPYACVVPYWMYQRVVQGAIAHAAEAGTLSATEVTNWWRDLEQAEQEGTFFAANFGFIVRGGKP
jgi:ubiquinone/menaquinone biosynthesis C-methylase UbiE